MAAAARVVFAFRDGGVDNGSETPPPYPRFERAEGEIIRGPGGARDRGRLFLFPQRDGERDGRALK